MPPIRDLPRLLAGLAPALDAPTWAFCQLPRGNPPPVPVLATLEEAEGLTVVLEAGQAADLGLPPLFLARRIVLTVHSDLEAVGLIARVSAALAAAGIPCNVVAGASHDHLFVPAALAERGLAVLRALSRSAGQRFRQVDVFAGAPYAGNGLAVFPEAAGLTPRQMLAITGELKQFESIFLDRAPGHRIWRARIFTVEEELPFAGHPSLGAAAVLHEEAPDAGDTAEWTLDLSGREVRIHTRRTPNGILATMDQGTATFGPPLGPADARPFLEALELDLGDAHPTLPLQVVSTGLPYLVVPIGTDLGRARIRHPDFEGLLATVGAKFVFPLDPVSMEGRTWDNQGRVEDVATGSAAGPAGAYLVRHGVASAGVELRLSQGARAGRPSTLRVLVRESHDGLAVSVAGEVVPIGEGILRVLPPP